MYNAMCTATERKDWKSLGYERSNLGVMRTRDCLGFDLKTEEL